MCRTARRSKTAPAFLLSSAELPTGVEHRQAFAGVELYRPQMLDDLFGCVPFLWSNSDVAGATRAWGPPPSLILPYIPIPNSRGISKEQGNLRETGGLGHLMPLWGGFLLAN